MKNNMTLLLLNAGRRIELIEAFRSAFKELGIKGRIVSTDINGLAPALYLSDAQYILPRSSSEGFTERFCEVCVNEKISLIIPLIDPDLLILAEHKKTIESTGAKVLISDKKILEICRDKRKTYKFLKDNGFSTPEIFSIEKARNQKPPFFLKPSDGSASENIYKINNFEELEFFNKYVSKAIIQEFLEGEEITTDVFLDSSCRALAAVSRKRLKVRSGEVSVACVINDPELELLCKQVAEKLGLVGLINIQTIKSKKSIHIIEINPRFGGGCPLSIAAGAPFAKWAILMSKNGKIPPEKVSIQEKKVMMRFDQSIFKDVSRMHSPL